MITKEEKCRNLQLNRIVISKDDKELRVYRDDLDKYLDGGWCKGISTKHKKSMSQVERKPILSTKPCSNETKLKISHTLKQKYKNGLSIGWKSYWKNNHSAWNKGLTKETDSRVNKMSRSKMGHEVSKAARLKISQKHRGIRVPKDKLKIQLTKEYITKKLHNSFNTSKPEEDLYKKLLKENQNKHIYRRYKCDRYPFYCDFYIEEDDLFIELNVHWTHGGHPYNPNNPYDQEQLKNWQEKAKKSNFYKQAIDTWTIRDVEKQKIAKENHLNYKVIY